MKNTQEKPQKIESCVTHPKEAHMTKQTDQPNPGPDILEKGTDLAVTHAKAVARGGELGPANPMGRPNLDHLSSRCILAGSLFLSSQGRLQAFPYLWMAGTDL